MQVGLRCLRICPIVREYLHVIYGELDDQVIIWIIIYGDIRNFLQTSYLSEKFTSQHISSSPSRHFEAQTWLETPVTDLLFMSGGKGGSNTQRPRRPKRWWQEVVNSTLVAEVLGESPRYCEMSDLCFGNSLYLCKCGDFGGVPFRFCACISLVYFFLSFLNNSCWLSAEPRHKPDLFFSKGAPNTSQKKISLPLLSYFSPPYFSLSLSYKTWVPHRCPQ